MNPQNPEYTQAFNRLLAIMSNLRQNCPWDQKQTLSSLRHLTIEETYELSDAILQQDMDEIRKELGDLLLHIVFYSKIASEQAETGFDIGEVINGLCDKLIHRHPHVYDNDHAENADAVKKNWEMLKLREKDSKKRVLSGVPASLPALLKAYRIQQKAHGVGFDWDDKAQVWEKIEEEMREFKAEFDVKNNIAHDTERAEHEFGDILFGLVNFARFVKINPETALENTNLKFIARFQHIEDQAVAQGKTIADLSIEEMEAYWLDAKRIEKNRDAKNKSNS